MKKKLAGWLGLDIDVGKALTHHDLSTAPHHIASRSYVLAPKKLLYPPTHEGISHLRI